MVDPAGPDLVDVVADVLSENGPMPEEQLAAAVLARGAVLGNDPGGELDEALDPTGTGAARWMMRWKPVVNAFAHHLR